MIDPSATAALALHQAGRFEDAEAAYRKLLADTPESAEVLQLLGTLLHQRNRNDEAIILLRRAIGLEPGKAAWHGNLGLALRALERFDEAETALRDATSLNPESAEAHSNLGLVLRQLGKLQEAAQSFRRAIALKPAVAGFEVNLGVTYFVIRDYETAAAHFRRALAIQPNHGGAHGNLGGVLAELDQREDAVLHLRRSLELRPNIAEAHRALAGALRDLGRMDEALVESLRALDLEPDNAEAMQILLFVENYLGRRTPAETVDAARQYGRLVSATVPRRTDHINSRDPDRRLRIGFLSGDYRKHPVGQFFGHLLPHFDRRQVEVTLYSNNRRDDGATQQFKRDADVWRPINKLNDVEAEALMLADGVDILVDLSGHTAASRLPLLGRKPAPVQVSWLGYSGTVGLETIDHIIADDSVIPRGDDDNFVERPVRLPDAYLCYGPPQIEAPIGPIPARRRGHVTFGSYNKLDKMSDATIACWAQVLAAVPGSKLLLKSSALGSPEVWQVTERRCVAAGIAADRLLLQPQTKSYAEHMQSYGNIDICLDPFPYNGTTTSCDALWMGVPFVSLVGDRFVSRVGASLLRTIGLPDLVASDVAGYVAIAAQLANDLDRLESLRATLRPRLLASPLGDAPRFVGNFEAALRGMWHEWCRSTPAAL